MTLQLSAGSPGGWCYPDGNKLVDIFGWDDRAAAVMLADDYCGPGLTCSLIETDDCDYDCHGTVDHDEFEGDEAARLEAFNAIEWHTWPQGTVTVLEDGTEIRVDVFDDSVVGRVNGARRIVGDDFYEVKWRLASTAVQVGVPA